MLNSVQQRFIENSREKIEAMLQACQSPPYDKKVQEVILSNGLPIKKKALSIDLILLGNTLVSLCDYVQNHMLNDTNAAVILGKHCQIIQISLADVQQEGAQAEADLLKALPLLVQHFHPSAPR